MNFKPTRLKLFVSVTIFVALYLLSVTYFILGPGRCYCDMVCVGEFSIDCPFYMDIVRIFLLPIDNCQCWCGCGVEIGLKAAISRLFIFFIPSVLIYLFLSYKDKNINII